MNTYAYDYTAASLYDGGWRSSDAEELKTEFGFTTEELEDIVSLLESYEKSGHRD